MINWMKPLTLQRSLLGYSFAVMRIVSVRGCWPSLLYRMGICLQGYAKTLASSPDKSSDFVPGLVAPPTAVQDLLVSHS